ncbi:uncharacterized protein LOC127446923 [Myxocyprinus asiaticus]|uniref:uncharacterized protein LOC127446923 n=1 Tax=Myxocyprinus asiaticus TaxID=70543 RepID=UPI00222242C0|nr:uncharacterized protein LOC127446923 [Myxocyprinus asiaticus]XP_051564217.1 uncharacterized protein LOC127446923 [Myxocyprinus asiaticus]
MMDMLSRAAASVGLEWNPPLSPEPSRLDDWFLGSRHRSNQPRHAPVPFFPEVHEELTKSWEAPFTARPRLRSSPALTTLDGGAARGYTAIPPVDKALAVHLCPQSAATWRGHPKLLSKPCRLTSSLTAKAYSAAGQAASALHAMALLQVQQAKALKELHEGSSAPDLMQELRSATDLALRATKVTARSLGWTMATLVVQERHLWLNLVEMGEADKTRFLAAPISQAGLFSDTIEDFAQQFSTVKQQMEAIRHILPRRGSRPRTPSARRQGCPPALPQPAPPARPRRGAHRRKPMPPVSQPAPKNPRRSSKRP